MTGRRGGVVTFTRVAGLVFLAWAGLAGASTTGTASGTAAAADAIPDPIVLRAQAQALFGSRPPAPPYGGTRETLGRALFFDTRLGRDGRTGCVSCHLPALRWRADRRSAAHQAEDSIKGSMGHADPGAIVPVLQALGYAPAFARAWPDEDRPLSATNFAAALEAYQRTLVTTSAFDRFLAGDDAALSPLQRRGLASFVGRGCAACHDGPVLGGTQLRRFGLTGDYWKATGSPEVDVGREAVTRDAADRYVFRVPILRHVARTAPYFHDGSVASLRDAVRIMGELQLGLALPAGELDALVAFLGALDGEVPPQFAAPTTTPAPAPTLAPAPE